MKLVDANVLLCTVNSDSAGHQRSRAWLDEAIAGREPVGMPWVVLLAFLRVCTRAGVFPRPLTVKQALRVMSGWLAQPGCVVPEPTARHAQVLAGLLLTAGTGGHLVTDAHLAALALEHGSTIVSWDRDFGRFPGVGVEQP